VRLILIPCCADKEDGGEGRSIVRSSLQAHLGKPQWDDLLEARRSVLAAIRSESRWTTGKYVKNRELKCGRDFGGSESGARYLPATQRYTGTLYKEAPTLADNASNEESKRSTVLVVSALYGLLHPDDEIQNYNLQMSESPAYRTWKQTLPETLLNFVTRNAVSEMFLLFGPSTAYLKVVMKALSPDLKRVVPRIVHFDVQSGSSYKTPQRHGQVLNYLLSGKRGQVADVAEKIV